MCQQYTLVETLKRKLDTEYDILKKKKEKKKKISI